MNLNGYVLVLPDMVGGNGYGSSFDEIVPPTKELFLRWLQANVFMPAIQFSFVPWDYDQEVSFLDLFLRFQRILNLISLLDHRNFSQIGEAT